MWDLDYLPDKPMSVTLSCTNSTLCSTDAWFWQKMGVVLTSVARHTLIYSLKHKGGSTKFLSQNFTLSCSLPITEPRPTG